MTAYTSRMGPLARGQGGLIAGLLGLALVGWLITDRRMAGMDAGPGTDLGTLWFYTSAWVVMMAAMMFPSIAPMVLVYRMIERRRRDLAHATTRGSTSMFVAGYLASWTVFGLLAYALFNGVRSLSIEAFSWHRGGPYVAGGVLLAAAIYQLTPSKDACLRRCRGPLQFLTQAWRDGPLGAFRMGLEHGSWCVGCCWALMAALFALGIMSLGWMVFVAALIAVEKLLPWRVPANRTIAAVLTALAVGVALAPASVPGLTLPDSAGAQRAMSAMHGGAMQQTMGAGRRTNRQAMGARCRHPAVARALGQHRATLDKLWGPHRRRDAARFGAPRTLRSRQQRRVVSAAPEVDPAQIQRAVRFRFECN